MKFDPVKLMMELNDSTGAEVGEIDVNDGTGFPDEKNRKLTGMTRLLLMVGAGELSVMLPA